MYDVIEFVFKYITFGVGIYFLFGTDNIGWGLYIGFTVLLFMALYLGIIGSMKEREANFTLMYTAGGVGIYFLLGTDSFLWNVYLILIPLCIVFLIVQLISEQQKIKTTITNLEPDKSSSKKEVDGAKEIVQQETHIQNGVIIEGVDSKNSQIQLHKKTEYELTREKEEQEELELQLQEKAEWGTNYQKRLENSLNNNQMSFGEILSINKQEMRKYSKEQQQLHDGLKGGTAILETEKHLFKYLSSYGGMHQRKINESISTIITQRKQSLIGANIEIIDYACGQGIGTICLLEQLKKHNIIYSIKNITLIEPSKIALKRSVLHIYYMLQSVQHLIAGPHSNIGLINMIKPVNKYLPSTPPPFMNSRKRYLYRFR